MNNTKVNKVSAYFCSITKFYNKEDVLVSTFTLSKTTTRVLVRILFLYKEKVLLRKGK